MYYQYFGLNEAPFSIAVNPRYLYMSPRHRDALAHLLYGVGAGGGFIITPALMSAGIKGILAVGTDLFHIFAKAMMGTVVHKKLGNISVGLAVAFLVGSGIGVLGGGVVNRTLEVDPTICPV